MFVLVAAVALLVGGTANVKACSGAVGKSAALANVKVADAATDFSAAARKKRKPAARASSRPANAAGGAGGGGAPTDKPKTDKPLSY
jgi:hypothetical protein